MYYKVLFIMLGVSTIKAAQVAVSDEQKKLALELVKAIENDDAKKVEELLLQGADHTLFVTPRNYGAAVAPWQVAAERDPSYTGAVMLLLQQAEMHRLYKSKAPEITRERREHITKTMEAISPGSSARENISNIILGYEEPASVLDPYLPSGSSTTEKKSLWSKVVDFFY